MLGSVFGMSGREKRSSAPRQRKNSGCGRQRRRAASRRPAALRRRRRGGGGRRYARSASTARMAWCVVARPCRDRGREPPTHRGEDRPRPRKGPRGVGREQTKRLGRSWPSGWLPCALAKQRGGVVIFSKDNTTLVSQLFPNSLDGPLPIRTTRFVLALVGVARASATPLRRAVHVRLPSHSEIARITLLVLVLSLRAPQGPGALLLCVSGGSAGTVRVPSRVEFLHGGRLPCPPPGRSRDGGFCKPPAAFGRIAR